MSRNTNTRLRASIRKDVFTIPLTYQWVPEPHHLFPDLTVERAALLTHPHEWVWMTSGTSTTTPRPHLKAVARKNPRTPPRRDPDDWAEKDYSSRGLVKEDRRHLRENLAERYDNNKCWVQETQDWYADLPYAYGWTDLEEWERELLGDTTSVLVERQTVWREIDQPDDPYIHPRPDERVIVYTTETMRRPKPTPQPPVTVEHLHLASRGRGVIHAITHSNNRGDIPRVARTRVWALARELGITASELVQHLRDTGEYVKSPASVIEPPAVRRIRTHLGQLEATT